MKRKFRQIRDKLLGINDTTHRIALGAGLGLFLGVFPGTGAIAAVVVAFILRANKAAALACSLLVNTWINIVTFPLALAIGGYILNVDPAAIARDFSSLKEHFAWKTVFDLLLRDTILAILTGYTLIGLALGIAGYALAYAAIRKVRRKRGT